jgi:hypothetical protein
MGASLPFKGAHGGYRKIAVDASFHNVWQFMSKQRAEIATERSEVPRPALWNFFIIVTRSEISEMT